MSDLDKALETTGTKNETELLKHIQEQNAKLAAAESQLEEQKAKLAAADLELEKVKRERTTAKTQATKAEKKLEESASENAILRNEVKELEENNSDLELELENQAKEINELKAKVSQNKNNLPSLEQLRAKAKIIMNQEQADKVFISLTAQVFLDENKAKNAFGTKYKVATRVDEDRVQLSNSNV